MMQAPIEFHRAASGLSRAYCVVLCLATTWLFSANAAAQSIPFKRERVSIEAKEESISTFIVRLLSTAGIPATASGLVSGTITGKFDRADHLIFNELVGAYGLTAYYDGTMAYVYSTAELTTKLVACDRKRFEQLEELMSELKVSDRRFPLKLSSVAGGTLRISGPPRYVELVEHLLSFIDTSAAPKRQQEVRAFKLKHATAADRTLTIGNNRTAVPGVVTLLRGLLEGASGVPVVAGIDRVPQAVSSLSSSVGGPIPLEGTLGKNVDSKSKENSRKPQLEKALESGVNTSTTSAVGQLDARPSVQADARINAVVVRDYAERMGQIEALIESLDTPTSLVEIEVKVIDVSSGQLRTLGTDFSAALTNIVGRAAVPNATLGVARATVVLANEKNSLLAQINALESNGEAAVQSTPRISTLDNHEAVLQSSQDIYVRVAGFQQVDLYPINVALTLRVTPTITVDEGRFGFRLAINIEDGSIGEAQVDQIPVINRTSLATNVTISDGESLLVGGLTSERRNNSQKGLPFLTDVPVLRNIFGTTTVDARKSERLFLITPKRVLVTANVQPKKP